MSWLFDNAIVSNQAEIVVDRSAIHSKEAWDEPGGRSGIDRVS